MSDLAADGRSASWGMERERAPETDSLGQRLSDFGEQGPRNEVFGVGWRGLGLGGLLAMALTSGGLSLTALAQVQTLPDLFSTAVGQQQPATNTGSGAGTSLGGVPAAESQNGSTASSPTGQLNSQSSRPGNETLLSPEQRARQGSTQQGVVTVAPEAPTEFQRLILNTTGKQVPIFGSSLFGGVPSTFAPVDNIPVTPDYVIGPGDELRLQIWGQVNQQGAFTVDRTGAISVPQLGTIHVAGVRYSDLSAFLRSQFGRVYRNFDLDVNLGQLRSIQVFVVGQARRPGSYTVSSLSTLLNALFASGGPSPTGSLRDIEVRRGTGEVLHFDLYDLLLRGDKSKDVRLMPQDVIFIPPVGPQVALMGSVNNPAIYELSGQTELGSLLQLTGGETNLAAGAEVRLERVYEHEVRSIDIVKQDELASTILRNGDVVTVMAIIDRFRNAVTLRGNVANPGRYQWHPGMRVTDLIPSLDSLVTRDFWLRRSQLAIPAPLTPQRTENEGSLQVASPSPAVGTGSTASSSAGSARSGPSASGGGNSVAAALSGGGSLFQPRTDVVLSAPDVDWSYAVIERQSKQDLKTSLIPFNLGQAVLDHNEAQNPELLPNDVVTIFSTADIRVPATQQTRFVRLEGEFRAAGVYSVLPGETLRHLVERAGGFTPDAYLYASEFTRQSTQRVERQRLNDYADQLEAQVTAVTASASSRALTDRDAAASDSAATAARAAINRLRQLEPIGRIVLQLKPDSEGPDSLPDLTLEDGDRFIVPKIPSSVYVEGQVYSANAFVFEPGRRTSTYLKLAGGPDREADRKRSFSTLR